MQQEITHASNVSLFMAEIIRRVVNGYTGDQILNDIKDARHHFDKLAILFGLPAESNEQPGEQNEVVAFCEWAKAEGWEFNKNGWVKHSSETPYVLTPKELYNEYEQWKQPNK